MKSIKFLLYFLVLSFALNSVFGEQNSSININDLVIISEENTISFTGDNLDHIHFNIAKKVLYKLNTQKGIDQISEFILPESFDPIYISHFPVARKYTHAYSMMKCDFFRAEIIKPNGDKKAAVIDESLEEGQIHLLYENFYGRYKKFVYKPQGLEPGDELLVEYSYNMPYNENFFELSSFRIFFNSDIYKEKYHLSVQHNAKLFVKFDFFNGAEPDSLVETQKTHTYYWSRKNLPGCIKETGSRPYLHLPYLVFNPHPYNFNYIVAHTNVERLTPFYTLYVREREKEHFSISVAMLQGVKNRQYDKIRDFIDEVSKDIQDDSLGYKKLAAVHNTIVDEFDFADDLDYFTRVDRRNPRMGDYLGAKQIRDIARYDVYLALILGLDLNYFTSYICDKRSGAIGDDFLKPMHQGDYLYTLLMPDDNLVFLYPKKSRFGYYLNEIPFYFENARTRLVHVNDYRNIEVAINEDFREVKLPVCKMQDNIRNSRIKVDVNVEEQTASFSGLVNLSGQFSTMTRGVYLYDYKDETVNALYGKKISDINDDVQEEKNIVEIKKKEPPFPTKITTKFQANNILTKSKDTLYLDVANWFNHIIYEDLGVSNRQMDYYPDFAHRDTYAYYIEFDKDISLIKEIENVQINIDQASLIINIEQINSKSIKIESHLAIGNKIEIEQLPVIQDIYNRITMLNSGKLKLVLQ